MSTVFQVAGRGGGEVGGWGGEAIVAPHRQVGVGVGVRAR
jgi:hypothetical protein